VLLVVLDVTNGQRISSFQVAQGKEKHFYSAIIIACHWRV
jgi:hypothetical protein